MRENYDSLLSCVKLSFPAAQQLEKFVLPNSHYAHKCIYRNSQFRNRKTIKKNLWGFAKSPIKMYMLKYFSIKHKARFSIKLANDKFNLKIQPQSPTLGAIKNTGVTLDAILCMNMY